MGKSSKVLGFYDVHMWKTIANKRWELQYCEQSKEFRYPPSPVCPTCLSMEFEWRPIKGTGEILSWAIFHRKYFDDFPPPYNTIAVRLDEGPIVVSNLTGAEPEGDWIGRRVEIEYVEHGDFILPRFHLAAGGDAA